MFAQSVWEPDVAMLCNTIVAPMFTGSTRTKWRELFSTVLKARKNSITEALRLIMYNLVQRVELASSDLAVRQAARMVKRDLFQPDDIEKSRQNAAEIALMVDEKSLRAPSAIYAYLTVAAVAQANMLLIMLEQDDTKSRGQRQEEESLCYDWIYRAIDNFLKAFALSKEKLLNQLLDQIRDSDRNKAVC